MYHRQACIILIVRHVSSSSDMYHYHQACVIVRHVSSSSGIIIRHVSLSSGMYHLHQACIIIIRHVSSSSGMYHHRQACIIIIVRHVSLSSGMYRHRQACIVIVRHVFTSLCLLFCTTIIFHQPHCFIPTQVCITKFCLIGIYELTLSPALCSMAGTDAVFYCIILDRALPTPHILSQTVIHALNTWHPGSHPAGIMGLICRNYGIDLQELCD